MRTWGFRAWWADHGTTLMWLAVALMTVVALVWLGYQFWRLLGSTSPIWPSSPIGAVDLAIRHREVHRWFAEEFIYGDPDCARDPPATYAILWPLLGWLALTPARWLWAVTTVAALGWLIYLVVRESGADTFLERFFVALIPLSMYATGATIGNGQLTVHILPVLATGLLSIRHERRGWHGDLLASACMLVALVKPSIAAPFFWMVLFVPGRLWPALLVASGYAALTLLAASFQELAPGPLLVSWLARASAVAGHGFADLHVWLSFLNLKEWVAPVSLLVLAALGLWTYRHRRADRWLLIGVAALIARFWVYHQWYDDLLILLPMVALFRIAKQGTPGSTVAGLLFVITMLSSLAPGGLYLFPPPWNAMYVAGQTMVWIAVLVFLLHRVRRERNAGVAKLSGRDV